MPQKVDLHNSSCPTKFSDGHAGHRLGDCSKNEGPSLHRHGMDNSNNFLPLVMSSAGLLLESTYLQLSAPTWSWISEIRVPTNTLYWQDSDFIQYSTIVESDNTVVCLRSRLSSVCRTRASWAPVNAAQSSKRGIEICFFGATRDLAMTKDTWMWPSSSSTRR